MFEHSLVESTPVLRSSNRWSAVISVAIQATLLTLLLALPLLHPALLPLSTPHLSQLAPPPRVPQPPPPPKPLHIEATTSPSNTTTTAPTATEPHLHPNPDPIPTLITGINLNPTSTSPFDSILTSSPASPNITRGGPATSRTPSAALHPGAPVPISTGVSAGLLLEPIRPIYPAIARISRTEGTVVVQAIISKSGRIESAHILSGPSTLQTAALDAVRNARYRPYLLNNQPTEVETTITITFHLGT